MLLSILLVVGVVSSNDTGYEGECLEEVVTLRRKVRLMETLHKQMEEKGKRLTLEHELLERDLQKKTEEVEELREAMRQAEEELPLSSAGTDKEKVRDLQGKVGALQLKVGMVSTQLERCSTQVKILLNGTEPEETPEQRRRLLETINRNGFLRELDEHLRELVVASMAMVVEYACVALLLALAAAVRVVVLVGSLVGLSASLGLHLTTVPLLSCHVRSSLCGLLRSTCACS